MKMRYSLLGIAALLASGPLLMAADLTGKITFKGTPPPEKEIPMDPLCSKLHTEKVFTRFYVVGADQGLADTFVYVKEGLPAGKKYDVPAKPVVLDQVGCEYTPYVLGAQAGQQIVVKNSDPVLHNVHPTPSVAGNQEYNKAQLPRGPELKFSWNNPELFLRFKCDVHPWMFAYVCLVDHPFYAVSDKDGKFTIEGLPPGKYVIEAIHRKAGKATQEITVGEDNQTVDFAFEVKK